MLRVGWSGSSGVHFSLSMDRLRMDWTGVGPWSSGVCTCGSAGGLHGASTFSRLWCLLTPPPGRAWPGSFAWPDRFAYSSRLRPILSHPHLLAFPPHITAELVHHRRAGPAPSSTPACLQLARTAKLTSESCSRRMSRQSESTATFPRAIVSTSSPSSARAAKGASSLPTGRLY